MKSDYTGYNGALLTRARDLRKNMTKQEKRLWYDFLKNYPVQFYRQRPIANYIADFYSSAAHLVIELDGSQHYTEDGLDYDAVRTQAIEQYGLEVLRFTNIDVDKHFEDVCRMIDDKVKTRMAK